jgi:hypothetical protein
MTGRPAALSAFAFASTASVAEGAMAARRADTRGRTEDDVGACSLTGP